MDESFTTSVSDIYLMTEMVSYGVIEWINIISFAWKKIYGLRKIFISQESVEMFLFLWKPLSEETLLDTYS